MKWNKAIGEGFYSLWLLVADANQMCHPDMSEECLKDICKSALEKENNHEGVELGSAIEAVIKNILMYPEFKNGLPRKDWPAGEIHLFLKNCLNCLKH